MDAFVCGALLDGTGTQSLEGTVLLVENGQIREVKTAAADVPERAQRVDFGDRVIIPGLIDAHLHLSGWRSMRPKEWLGTDRALHAARAVTDLDSLLCAGFTAVRDLGSATGLGLRRAVTEGTVPGPRIYTSGRLLTQTGGHADLHDLPIEWLESDEGRWFELVDGPDECRAAARRLLRRDVDVIKIVTSGGVLWQKSAKDAPDQSQFTDAEVQAITEEAHRVGVPVASHAQGPAGVRRAVTNGVDTVEHGTILDEESVDLLLDNDAVLVPTLSTNERRLRADDSATVPESDQQHLEDIQHRHIESVRMATEAGVDIALGTDFLGTPLLPHGENVLEAELLVEKVGLPPGEVLHAATGVAGEALGDPSLGTLTPGAEADFVVLESDPTECISALQMVDSVYKSGIKVA
jgi:imidazolonepropionase-like amidohydrolase